MTDEEKTDKKEPDQKELDSRALIGDIQQYYLDLVKSLTKGSAPNPAFTQGVLLGGIQTLKLFGYDAVIDINVKITKRIPPIADK